MSIETQVSVRDEKKHPKRWIKAAELIKKRAEADIEERRMRARGRISRRRGNEQKYRRIG